MNSLIPAQHAEIFFNRDADGSPSHDIFVCDRRSRNIGTPNQIYIGKRFRSSCGAVYTNWMNSNDRMLTPEGVFASVWLNSTKRPALDAMKAARREFGKLIHANGQG